MVILCFIVLISSEVEKDLAKLAEQGKLNRSPNSPHRSSLLTPLFHTTNTLPVLGQTSRPQSPSSLSTKTAGLPLHNTKPTSLVMGRTSPSNPSSRARPLVEHGLPADLWPPIVSWCTRWLPEATGTKNECTGALEADQSRRRDR